jgi:hypothetical protein
MGKTSGVWNVVLRHYGKYHRSRVLMERRWFASAPTLIAALTRAAHSVDWRGKRFLHQRRIKRRALALAEMRLLRAYRKIAHCADFDSLLNTISAEVRNIRGIGELYCYDTALRIGAYLHLEPDYVYLHCGTREGAKALGLVDSTKQSLSMKDFPRPARQLRPFELEDVLCIYKELFAAAQKTPGKNRRRCTAELCDASQSLRRTHGFRRIC